MGAPFNTGIKSQEAWEKSLHPGRVGRELGHSVLDRRPSVLQPQRRGQVQSSQIVLRLQHGIILFCFPKTCHCQEEGICECAHSRTLPCQWDLGSSTAVVVRNFQKQTQFPDGKRSLLYKTAFAACSVCASGLSVCMFHLKEHPTSLLMEEIWFNKALWLFWVCCSVWQKPPAPSSNFAVTLVPVVRCIPYSIAHGQGA